MQPLFVTGGPRSGKSFSLAARLSEVLGFQSAVWISAHRLSAEAFKHDLARWFPGLVGRLRITTPRGLVSSGLEQGALVVCDDVDCWSAEDLLRIQ